MPHRRDGRREALLGLVGMIVPQLVLAARPALTLATGALPPLTSAPGHTGFLDALALEIFGRIGFDATVVRLPVERALINANAGIEDGDMFRAPGFEKDYPNLVQIPEKVLDFDFMAYATQPDVQVRGWADLASYSVGYVTGWKIFERNVKTTRDVTTVRGLEQLFPLLVTRRADVVLLDRWQGLWLAREAGIAVRSLDPPLAKVPMFAYLHRRHEALVAPAAAAMAQAKRDGIWQRLYDQILKPLEAAR
jgi:polar amino acid transport system substrate-binding protein